MKIRTLHYSALFSLGNYQNEKFGLTADLDESESVEEATEALRQKVYVLAGQEDTLNQRYDLKRELAVLQSQIETARRNYEDVMTFLTAQGIKADAAPFPTLIKAIAPATERVYVDDSDVIDDEYDPMADE